MFFIIISGLHISGGFLFIYLFIYLFSSIQPQM